MRAFEKPNLSNDWKCPICGTNEEKEVVLIGIDGTEEGNNIQAQQYHLSCIELTEYNTVFYAEDTIVIAMIFKPKKEDFE